MKFENNPDLFLSRAGAASRFVPRDVITQITNGLGAVTQLGYAPLTNKDVYRRGSMLYGLNYGRGSPVLDFLAPTYVVFKASSSAPQAGNPNAMASVYYRYASARMQGGGRGFLGYRQIDTFDPNHGNSYIVTSTTYAQNFPYAGMPEATVKQVVGSAYQVPPCLSGPMTEGCYATPGHAFSPIAGSMFSNSVQQYESDTEIGSGATTAFAPGVQAPVQVRTMGTQEILRDPFANVQTSKVATSFDYGAYGNVSATSVDTYSGTATSPMSTVSTVHSYNDTPASWLLGRLTASTVTHQRSGRTDVVRKSGFSYAPTTGLLTQERAGAEAGADQESLKVYG
ncbi:toxin TcdB middle/N-terminal domain-containing protein, partial [Luteimonas aquatica]|uniref:toxin TcdB middle/N-terminal domain-containing protein n=1 Tax=Luteimonas aquatica TaxID=450364 RepID=UPI001F56343A